MSTGRRAERLLVDAEIGQRVRSLMWDQHVTQDELGKQLGVGQSGLARRLSGERGWTAWQLRTTSRALGVTVGYLFGETAAPQRRKDPPPRHAPGRRV